MTISLVYLALNQKISMLVKQNNSWINKTLMKMEQVGTYKTNACSNPEYAMRGMIKRIFLLSNSFNMDLNSEHGRLTGESWCDSSIVLFFLKNSIKTMPSDRLMRNRMKSNVVPLVLCPWHYASTFNITDWSHIYQRRIESRVGVIRFRLLPP